MKSEKLLIEFCQYCSEHPDERFWQALRNWSGYSYVCVSEHFPSDIDIIDTFYFEKKTK